MYTDFEKGRKYNFVTFLNKTLFDFFVGWADIILHTSN